MSVPFEKIGPGQSARIVMQVMGKRGPVFNPNGIRYLPVEGASAMFSEPSLGLLTQAATAMSGLNILVSAGTLALSAATLAEVKKITHKVDRLLDGQIQLGRQLDQILAKLTRIEIKVSEARLATLITHACSSAALSDEEISFAPFAELAGDLDSFIKDAGIVRGIPSSLRVGSDIRVSLTRVCRLLRGARLMVAEGFNRHAGPERAWRCDPLDDYWSRVEEQKEVSWHETLNYMVRKWKFTAYNAHIAVYNRFLFSGTEDHLALQHGLDLPIVAAWQSWGISEEEATARLVTCRKRASGNVSWTDDSYREGCAKEILAETREIAFRNPKQTIAIPPSVIDAWVTAEGAEKAKVLPRYRAWWLYDTDAGLVYRAYRECMALRDGYPKAWPSELSAVDSEQLLPNSMSVQSLPEPAPVLVDLQMAIEAAI